MPVSRCVVSVFLLLGLVGAALAHGIGVGPGAAPVQPARAGVDPCELIVNGGFESPELVTSTSADDVPTGWTGTARIRNGSIGDSFPVDGSQFVIGIFGTLSQAIPTADLDGQTLTASFSLRTFFEATTVTLGDVSQTLNRDNAYAQVSLSYILPDPAPDTTTLSFGSEELDLDAVSVTVPRCADQSPVISGLETSLTTDEDTPITTGFTVSDPDTLPGDLTLTATGPGAPRVTFGGSGADRTLTYTPSPDANGPDSFTVVVSNGTDADTQDVAVTITPVDDPPVFTDDPPDIGPVEATGPGGATVAFPIPTVIDSDGVKLSVVCSPDSGSLFALGETTVTCAVVSDEVIVTVDFTVTVVDTTSPTLTVPTNIKTEATSPAGADAPFTVSATDLVSGSVPVTCRVGQTVITSPAVFPIGTTTIDCTATDAAGNDATDSFAVTVRDRTGPVITFVGGPQPNRSYTRSTLPGEPTCTATDAASVVTQCRVYGYSTAVGTHTLTARARDAEGNSSVATRTYTVIATPATATPVPPRPTATSTRPVRPTTTPVTPVVPPTATPTVQPTVAPTRPPRR